MNKTFGPDPNRKPLKIGEALFDWYVRTYVMGIVNVTPDSFYDGGRYTEPQTAVEHGLMLINEGADILDIGGESTRPKGPYGEGAQTLPAQEELRRVIPVIEGIRKRSRVPISIDTYKSEVAATALDAGADMINDVSGLQMDPRMPEVAARHAAPVVINHMKGTPQNMQQNPEYGDLIGEITGFFRDKFRILAEAGVPRERIIVDPGLGFGKSFQHNLEVIHRLKEFQSLGCPVLVGPSRKSFVGHYAGDLPPVERLEGTIAAAVLCTLNGANILRVHDVKACVRAIRLTEAYMRQGVKGD
ncbi:MAG: dihydropteroate synthase [bacterium]